MLSGYVAVLDKQKLQVPKAVDPSGGIALETRVIYEFSIEFPRPTIRRG